MDNEKRIEEVMKSLDGIHRAEASPFLYNGILNKINRVQAQPVPVKFAWMIAASFALLLLLNISAIRSSLSSSDKHISQERSSGYQLVNENSINYN